MGVSDGSLTLMRKSTENASTPVGIRLSLYGLIDHILTEAAQCVMSKVGGRRPVAFVLITPNALSLSLAFLGRTGKEVEDTALMYLNLHLRLKECVYWRPPSFLGCHCELK